MKRVVLTDKLIKALRAGAKRYDVLDALRSRRSDGEVSAPDLPIISAIAVPRRWLLVLRSAPTRRSPRCRLLGQREYPLRVTTTHLVGH